MLKIEKYVLPSPEQWQIIIDGMRNPLDSWSKSDTTSQQFFLCGTSRNNPERWCSCPIVADMACKQDDCKVGSQLYLGRADRKLMEKLAAAGSEHRKYMRMIPIIATITAPAFWWSEADTYKVGTTRNSCSKMHRIHANPLTLDSFTHEGCDQVPMASEHLKSTIAICDCLREAFNNTQEKRYWRALIELLPQGYMMKATLSLNYEVLCNMYHQRKGHKLTEWRDFCAWVETLPYSELITAKALANK